MDAPPQHERGVRRIGVLPCSVDGCDRKILTVKSGLCRIHYSRLRATGKVGPPHSLKAEGGSITLSKAGYLNKHDKDGSRGVHCLVMEGMLGRPLHPFEKVHHRNGLRSDNRPANLELWIKGHPAGQRVEDLVAFVIGEYPEACAQALASKLAMPDLAEVR